MSRKFFVSAILISCLAVSSAAFAAPIMLETQGSFAIGGTTVTHDGEFSMEHFTAPEGQIAYGDHAYVFYQIPVNAKKFPMVFQHGAAQTKRTWETTPDGRDGFQNLFLKKGFSVYLVDQPRRGEAGLSTVPPEADNPYAHNPMYANRTLFTLPRLGIYPDLFPGSQFPKDEESLNQFMRAWTVDTGALDFEVAADAMSKLIDKIGGAILVTHSMGDTIGWRTPLRTEKVKAIVAYEPGGSPFLFPEDGMPEPVQTAYGAVAAMPIPTKEFDKLTKMPIIIYYGDNIASEPTTEVGPDQWRGELEMAKKFVKVINERGGDATLVHLPEIGIKGNTHFLMGDLNNAELADMLEKWLADKNLE
ncbi:MAG: alpha/beta fold hydrolase [Synergistaceae bacterium]|nr:alpha/beta fold hydrolase [Synergistaceae bacterium]